MKRLLVISLTVLMFITSCNTKENYFEKSFSADVERVWAGPEFWTNRLQDWRVQNGRLECVAGMNNMLYRTAHILTRRLTDEDGEVKFIVDCGLLDYEDNDNGAAGFLIGAGPELDVLGASLVMQKLGPGAGFFAGIRTDGTIFVKDMETGELLAEKRAKLVEINKLKVSVKQALNEGFISVSVEDVKITTKGIEGTKLKGNIALVSHPGEDRGNKAKAWFNNIELEGHKLEKLDVKAGPVLSAQYTVANSILKLNAQLMPVSDNDPDEVVLEINEDGAWKEAAIAKIVRPGYTALFRVENWDNSKDVSYRVVYNYFSSTNEMTSGLWEGTIRHDPIDKEEIVIAGFTGNHNIAHPGLGNPKGRFNFNKAGIWYPQSDLVDKVKVHKPDLLFFSGDQVYEGASPTGVDRDNYELDYLYKWYLYCLAYRDITKDIPTISIPDDHDIYQGNIWGQSGRKAKVDNQGGYVHPAWFVKMVERTQCNNLPDPYDPTPVEQGIGVYYSSMNLGGIGIAVIEDRKFKSGCADNPFIVKNRPDHVIDPNYDFKKIDMPGKVLLGDRQLKFLNDWGTNWKGQEMKIVMSQTIFANMATHHGRGLMRLVADLDSNGWPQTGRNKAVDALRKAFAFHLGGDQHLASIVHHGVDNWNDAMYSFCVPSVANFYPRAWFPESVGKNRPEGSDKNMGEHRDGFGNYVTVYGVTNPSGFTGVSTGVEPLGLHDKMPGYGIVKMNKSARTITMECWPRYAVPGKDKQYKGWPKTISQFDNYGREAVAYLPEIKVSGMENPVVQVVNEKSGEIVYTVRIKGISFKPKVFAKGKYTLSVGEPGTDKMKVLKGITANSLKESKVLNIEL